MLNIIDEFTRECLAIRLARKLNSTDVIDALSDLFILRGVPGHVRSDNVLRAEGNEAGNQSLSVRQHSRCMALVKLRNRTRRLPPLKEEVSSIANRVRVLAALTVLNTSF